MCINITHMQHPERVHVKLRVVKSLGTRRGRKTKFFVAVLGNILQLGDNSPEKAPRATFIGNDTWEKEIWVAAHSSFEYTWIVVNQDKNEVTQTESVPTRILSVDTDKVIVQDYFDTAIRSVTNFTSDSMPPQYIHDPVSRAEPVHTNDEALQQHLIEGNVVTQFSFHNTRSYFDIDRSSHPLFKRTGPLSAPQFDTELNEIEAPDKGIGQAKLGSYEELRLIEAARLQKASSNDNVQSNDNLLRGPDIPTSADSKDEIIPAVKALFNSASNLSYHLPPPTECGYNVAIVEKNHASGPKDTHISTNNDTRAPAKNMTAPNAIVDAEREALDKTIEGIAIVVEGESAPELCTSSSGSPQDRANPVTEGVVQHNARILEGKTGAKRYSRIREQQQALKRSQSEEKPQSKFEFNTDTKSPSPSRSVERTRVANSSFSNIQEFFDKEKVSKVVNMKHLERTRKFERCVQKSNGRTSDFQFGLKGYNQVRTGVVKRATSKFATENYNENSGEIISEESTNGGDITCNTRQSPTQRYCKKMAKRVEYMNKGTNQFIDKVPQDISSFSADSVIDPHNEMRMSRDASAFGTFDYELESRGYGGQDDCYSEGDGEFSDAGEFVDRRRYNGDYQSSCSESDTGYSETDANSTDMNSDSSDDDEALPRSTITVLFTPGTNSEAIGDDSEKQKKSPRYDSNGIECGYQLGTTTGDTPDNTGDDSEELNNSSQDDDTSGNEGGEQSGTNNDDTPDNRSGNGNTGNDEGGEAPAGNEGSPKEGPSADNNASGNGRDEGDGDDKEKKRKQADVTGDKDHTETEDEEKEQEDEGEKASSREHANGDKKSQPEVAISTPTMGAVEANQTAMCSYVKDAEEGIDDDWEFVNHRRKRVSKKKEDKCGFANFSLFDGDTDPSGSETSQLSYVEPAVSESMDSGVDASLRPGAADGRRTEENTDDGIRENEGKTDEIRENEAKTDGIREIEAKTDGVRQRQSQTVTDPGGGIEGSVVVKDKTTGSATKLPGKPTRDDPVLVIGNMGEEFNRRREMLANAFITGGNGAGEDKPVIRNFTIKKKTDKAGKAPGYCRLMCVVVVRASLCIGVMCWALHKIFVTKYE